MKNEYPIPFRSDLVELIRLGLKTETRRVIRNYSGCQDYFYIDPNDSYPYYYRRKDAIWESFKTLEDLIEHRCPYKIGNKLWVKETWAGIISDDNCPISDMNLDPRLLFYKLAEPDAREVIRGKWRSSRYMPKKVARTWINITTIGVERLWDISRNSCKAEGIRNIFGLPEWTEKDWDFIYQQSFAKLWDSINGKNYPWSQNCWVWVYGFEYER